MIFLKTDFVSLFHQKVVQVFYSVRTDKSKKTTGKYLRTFP